MPQAHIAMGYALMQAPLPNPQNAAVQQTQRTLVDIFLVVILLAGGGRVICLVSTF